MSVRVDKYEVCNIGTLVIGDMYVNAGQLYTVLEKRFDFVKAFNNERHTMHSYTIPCGLIVTRVKGGFIQA